MVKFLHGSVVAALVENELGIDREIRIMSYEWKGGEGIVERRQRAHHAGNSTDEKRLDPSNTRAVVDDVSIG
jgi:hypothetical protein